MDTLDYGSGEGFHEKTAIMDKFLCLGTASRLSYSEYKVAFTAKKTFLGKPRGLTDSGKILLKHTRFVTPNCASS